MIMKNQLAVYYQILACNNDKYAIYLQADVFAMKVIIAAKGHPEVRCVILIVLESFATQFSVVPF